MEQVFGGALLLVLCLLLHVDTVTAEVTSPCHIQRRAVGACECTGPTSPTNGVANPSSTSIHYGSSVTYTCNTGYTLSGSSIRTCQNNGQLSGSQPSCKPISCTGLTSPTNGVANPSSTSIQYGSSVIYTCNTGYSLSGSSSRTCQNNGQLSGSQPSCNVVYCEGVPNPTNGVANPSSTSIQYGSSVRYTCNPRYTLSGSRTRTCQSNGQLGGSQPSCNLVFCTGLTSPTNGVANPSSTSIQYGSSVIYTCNTGYSLSGSILRTCQNNGQLSGNQPSCDPISCTGLTSPTNGVANPRSTSVQYSSSVTYNCSTGYTLSGSSSRTCQDNGQLSGIEPFCNPIFCGGVSNPQNGVANPSSISIQYDTTVTYTCNTGYTLSGSSSRTCQSNGLLDGSQPSCNLVSCTGLTSPTNAVANPSSTSMKYGTTVTYTCNTGYTLSGSSSRTCQDNGQLSGSLTSCNLVYCTGLTSPTNGVAIPSSTSIQYGTIVTYTCNTGYTLSGSSTRTCQVNGQLSGSQPSCNLAVPGPPTNVTCQDHTDEGFTLVWAAPSQPNGDLVGYKIEVYLQNSSLLRTIDNTLSISTTYTIQGLQPGSYYKFRVFTINEQYTSSSYAWLSTCATRAKIPVDGHKIGLIIGLVVVAVVVFVLAIMLVIVICCSRIRRPSKTNGGLEDGYVTPCSRPSKTNGELEDGYVTPCSRPSRTKGELEDGYVTPCSRPSKTNGGLEDGYVTPCSGNIKMNDIPDSNLNSADYEELRY